MVLALLYVDHMRHGHKPLHCLELSALYFSRPAHHPPADVTVAVSDHPPDRDTRQVTQPTSEKEHRPRQLAEGAC